MDRRIPLPHSFLSPSLSLSFFIISNLFLGLPALASLLIRQNDTTLFPLGRLAFTRSSAFFLPPRRSLSPISFFPFPSSPKDRLASSSRRFRVPHFLSPWLWKRFGMAVCHTELLLSRFPHVGQSPPWLDTFFLPRVSYTLVRSSSCVFFSSPSNFSLLRLLFPPPLRGWPHFH